MIRRRIALVVLVVNAALVPPAAATPRLDTSHVRQSGQICTRVPRGPDEWYSGPPYRIVCQQIARPEGLSGRLRR